MAPGAHLLISWLSTVEIFKARRERVLVTLSGVAPDLDGLGLVVDKITGTTTYYFNYHHYLGHSIFSAVILSSLVWLISTQQRVLATVFAFIIVHLHILCDLVGSKGPDGYQWPIYYLYPYNDTYSLSWSGQWALNAWPNQLIFVVSMGLCAYYINKRQISFFEIFGRKFDATAVQMYKTLVAKIA